MRYRDINGCEMLFYLETARRLFEHIGLARQCLELILERVQRLLDKKREPVLLKIRNVPVKFVGTENGEDIFSLIDLYDRYFREGVISGNPQNFRLTTPVKWEDISVEEMVPHC